jgi:hypothetical protein
MTAPAATAACNAHHMDHTDPRWLLPGLPGGGASRLEDLDIPAEGWRKELLIQHQ